MPSWLSGLFGKGEKDKSATRYVLLDAETKQYQSREGWRWVTCERFTDRLDPKGQRTRCRHSKPVAQTTSLADASAASLSFGGEFADLLLRGSKLEHVDFENRAEGTRSGLSTWRMADGSLLAEEIQFGTQEEPTNAHMQQPTAIRDGQIVRVHYLDPNGNRAAELVIGRDIPLRVYRELADPQTGELYGLITYERGEAKASLLRKQLWEEARAAFAGVDEEAKRAFGSVRKSQDPANLVLDLRACYTRATEAIASVDGPFPHVYECGVFVASFATHEIIHSGLPNAPALADALNSLWVDHVVGSYLDGAPPPRAHVVKALQDHWRGYCDLLPPCLSGSEEGRHSGTVQLTWDLWSNCTGKPSPAHFTNLVLASPLVLDAAIQSIRCTRDWTGVKQ